VCVAPRGGILIRDTRRRDQTLSLSFFPRLSGERCWVLRQLSRLLLLLLLPRASIATCRSQCSPPDPNSKLRIRVIPARSQLQALDRNVRRQNSKPRIRVICAGPQLQALDRSVRRTRTATSGYLWVKAIPAGPQLQATGHG